MNKTRLAGLFGAHALNHMKNNAFRHFFRPSLHIVSSSKRVIRHENAVLTMPKKKGTKKRAVIESKEVPDVYEAWLRKQSTRPVTRKSALKSSEVTEKSS
jgi:hypothetical protein